MTACKSRARLNWALGAALVLLGPRPSQAWSLLTHRAINRMAAFSVPREMYPWYGYAGLLGELASGPDFWKSADPLEGPRHYINLETYGRTDHLPLEPVDGGVGQIHWVILQLQHRLEQAFRSGDPELTVRLAAAQGHYVSDAHMPLHTTVNFNGWQTGNDGIHGLWEDEMALRAGREGFPVRQAAAAVEDVWQVIEQEIVTAYGRAPAIMRADDKARRMHERETDAYYATLWQETAPLFREQVNAATRTLASLWYTAWVKAGRPAIAPPPAFVSTDSIHLAAPDLPPDQTQPLPRPNWVLPALLLLAGLLLLVLGIKRPRHPASKKPRLL